MAPKFSLQSVLDYRQKLVESLELQLGQLMYQEKLLNQEMETTFIRQQAALGSLSSKMVGMLAMEKLDQIRLEIRTLDRLLEALQQERDVLMAEIDDKRREIAQAKQDEEVLQNLKDKMLEDYRLEVDRQENLLMDDLNIARAYQQLKEAQRVAQL